MTTMVPTIASGEKIGRLIGAMVYLAVAAANFVFVRQTYLHEPLFIY